MKICVVQPDLSRIGGSISTIIAFADCFKELGHEVNVKSSFGERFPQNLIANKDKVINHYGCKFLTQSDITWDLKILEKIWTNADICFTRGFDSFPTKDFRSISWIVIPKELKKNSNIIYYWTNSKTTKNKFGEFKNKTRIVVPPHDYSLFRENISLHKEWDVTSILRGNDFKLKGLQTYADTIKKIGCKSLLITTSTSNDDLKRIKSLGVPFVLNQTKQQVAEILGQSNIFFFPSYYESCPLVIYEALNAGCTIVSRNVGAVKEQLKENGYIFNNDSQCIEALEYGLNNLLYKHDLIDRGLKFDRINQLQNIKNRLKEV